MTIDLKRTGALTHVEIDGEHVGYVKRSEVSNPSPRGGAYRVQHVAWFSAGRREQLGIFDTRKDAVAAIARAAGITA